MPSSSYLIFLPPHSCTFCFSNYFVSSLVPAVPFHPSYPSFETRLSVCSDYRRYTLLRFLTHFILIPSLSLFRFLFNLTFYHFSPYVVLLWSLYHHLHHLIFLLPLSTSTISLLFPTLAFVSPVESLDEIITGGSPSEWSQCTAVVHRPINVEIISLYFSNILVYINICIPFIVYPILLVLLISPLP